MGSLFSHFTQDNNFLKLLIYSESDRTNLCSVGRRASQ
jgi:hypothetical protein